MVFTYCIVTPASILNYIPLDKVARTLQCYHPAGSVMLGGYRHSTMGFPIPDAFVHNKQVYIRYHYDIDDITYNKDNENSINACMGLHKYGIINDTIFTLPDGRVVEANSLRKRSLADMEEAYWGHLSETGELYKDTPPLAVWQR
jgi:hypothetical protein